MADRPTGSRVPHVLLLIANDVVVDTRVLKYAASLSDLGLRVTVLGVSATNARMEGRLAGGARVIRVPAPLRLRSALRVHRDRPPGRPWLGYRTRAEATAAKLRRKLDDRELIARAGWLLGDQERGVPGLAGRRARLLVDKALRKPRWAAFYARGALYKGLRKTVRRGRQDPAAKTFPYWAQPYPWRTTVPEIEDYELALGPVIDRLVADVDVIHPHDVFMLGIAARAAGRARAKGHRVKVVYDAREYIPGLPAPPPEVVQAYTALEAEYIRHADRVITVSEPIAAELRRCYGLDHTPDLVLNAPVVAKTESGEPPSIRAAAGIDAESPVLVYGGGVAESRGVHTVVDALPELPGVHLVVVSRRDSHYTRQLEEQAARLGVADRFHLVPFVDSDHVVEYVSSATIGVIPLLHAGNHDWALTNKYFEYMHAGLPIITSDVEVQDKLTRELRNGEVFVAGDAADLVRAIRAVLADREAYTRVYRDRPELLEQFTWQAQAAVLRGLYRDLLGGLPPEADRPIGLLSSLDVLDEAELAVEQAVQRGLAQRAEHLRDGAPHLGIGPVNSAGQATAWARAVSRQLPGVRADSFAMEHASHLNFPADEVIPAADWASRDWQLPRVERVLGSYSHLLLEAGRGALGTLNGGLFADDLPLLRRAGIEVGLVFHGSELRDPRRHRELEPNSPFRDPDEELTAKLQEVVGRINAMLAGFTGPRFVSTCDLLDYLPEATWLPLVVDPADWAPGPQPLTRDVPVVMHAPSKASLKGSDWVEAAVKPLAGRGLIDYRRIEGVRPAEMPDLVRAADVILDQFAIGDYGAMACQSMAAGRVVVGHVADRVRARYPEDPPVVQAGRDTLAYVLERLVTDRDEGRRMAARAAEYAARFHDGTHAAQVLGGFLGVP